MKNYVCGICGKSYDSLESYMNCVAACGEALKAEQKAKEEQEKREKLNAALNGVKQAKKYFEEQLEKFEKEYPEEYKLNFGESYKCSNDTCKCSKTDNTKSGAKTETIELSYESDGKNKPKMSAKINGKEVDDKTLGSMFDDPDTRYIAKMLGII